jgi:hypothetical protein
MLQKNKPISIKGLTSYLNAIHSSLTTQSVETSTKKERFLLTLELWQKIQHRPDINIVTINAILSIFCNCAEIGGWEQAWEVFERLRDPRKAFPSRPVEDPLCLITADTITFSLMIKVCSKAKTEKSFELGMQLWSDFNQQKRLITTLHADNGLHQALIYLGLNAPTLPQTRQVFLIIAEAYHLPFTATEERRKGKAEHKVDVPTLCLLLQLLIKLKEPELGIRWFKLGKKRFEMDHVKLKDQTAPYAYLAQLLQESNHFEVLWKLFTECPKPKLYSLELRLCAYAASQEQKNSEALKRWSSRALSIQESFPVESWNFKDLFNFVECLSKAQLYSPIVQIGMLKQTETHKWIQTRFEKAQKQVSKTSKMDKDLFMDVKLLQYYKTALLSVMRTNKDLKMQEFYNRIKSLLNMWGDIRKKQQV